MIQVESTSPRLSKKQIRKGISPIVGKMIDASLKKRGKNPVFTPKKHLSRGILSYKTYSFLDKDPVIDVLRTAMQEVSLNNNKIAEMSGVSATTLSGWFQGKTRRPIFATVNAVARALGCEFRLVRISEHP